MWKLKTFAELTNDEIYAIMHLRNSIFVVEQNRLYQEIDPHDKEALHLFKIDADGDIVAYSRIFTIDDGQKVTFGRVATSKKVRGQGVGRDLLDQIMHTIGEYFPNLPIEIEAQEQVQGYYEKADFKREGDVFTFNFTPHVKMIHAPITK